MGLTVQAKAYRNTSNGVREDVTDQVTWSSSDESVLSVSSDGQVTALSAQAQAQVMATYQSLEGETNINTLATTLERIDVTPVTMKLPRGFSEVLTGSMVFDDGTQLLTSELSKGVIWTSSDPSIVNVNDNMGGVITGVSAGSAEVSVSVANVQSSASQVSVFDYTIKSLQLTSDSTRIPLNGTRRLATTATLESSGQVYTVDASDVVSFDVTEPSIIRVVDALAQGLALGASDVTAMLDGERSNTLSMTVEAFDVVSMTLMPNSVSLLVGQVQPYQVLAELLDGTTEPVTNLVELSSSEPLVASMEGNQLKALSAGQAQVIAKWPVTGIQALADATVLDGTFNRLDIQLSDDSIAQGQSTTLKAIATSTNGDQVNVSSMVNWEFSDPSAVSFEPDHLLLTGLQPQQISVNADLPSFNLVDATPLDITTATLSHLSFAEPGISVPVGFTQQATLFAHFSDGSNQDITHHQNTQWSGTPTSILTVNQGLVEGLVPGTGETIATYQGKSAALPVSVTTATLSDLQLTPQSASIATNSSQAYQVIARFSDSSTQDVTTTVSWVDNTDPSVATITRGVAQSHLAGQTQFKAQLGGINSPVATLDVYDYTLDSITILPTSQTMLAGTAQVFTAMAHYSNGPSQDVTSSVAWGSDDMTVADFSRVKPNELNAYKVGNTTVNATYQGKTAQAAISVLANLDVQSLEIMTHADPLALAVGESQLLSAQATLVDGTLMDVTSMVDWSSDDAAVVMSGSTAQARAVGNAMLTATLFGLYTDTLDANVTAKTLTSIAVTPAFSTLEIAGTQSFSAEATYSDNSKADVTSQVSWSSTNSAIVTLQDEVATGVRLGLTQVTAALNGVIGSSTVDVVPSTLANIRLDYAGGDIPAGDYTQMQAIGIMQNGGEYDITSQVTWDTTDPAIAVVNGLGQVHGVSDGQVDITIDYQGKQDAITLNVTSAQLNHLTVSPSSVTLYQGLSRTLSAVAHYTDSSTQPVTASWASNAPGTATVGPTSGEVEGVSSGMTTIEATYSGHTALAVIEVTNGSLPDVQSHTITPSSLTLGVGQTVSVKAIVEFVDGRQADVTASVMWEASGNEIDVLSRGIIEAKSVGTSILSIKNSDGTVLDSITVTIEPPVLEKIELPSVVILAPGGSQKVEAVGHFSDGSTENPLQNVTWRNGDTLIADVDNQGNVNAVGYGDTEISATRDGVTETMPVTVVTRFPIALHIQNTPSTMLRTQTRQPTATMEYNDGTYTDVTSEATWYVSGSAVNIDADTGEVQGVQSGSSSDITAEFLDLVSAPHQITVIEGQSITFSVSGSTGLRVQTAQNNPELFIDWGDNTSEELSASEHGHTYGAAYTGDVTFRAETTPELTTFKVWGAWDFTIAELTALAPDLEKLTIDASQEKPQVTGSLSELPDSLNQVLLSSGNGNISGTTSDLPPALEDVHIRDVGLGNVTINLDLLPSKTPLLQALKLGGGRNNIELEGDISNLANLPQFYKLDSWNDLTGLSGDIATLPSSMTTLRLHPLTNQTNLKVDYSSIPSSIEVLEFGEHMAGVTGELADLTRQLPFVNLNLKEVGHSSISSIPEVTSLLSLAGSISGNLADLRSTQLTGDLSLRGGAMTLIFPTH